jgi:cytosine/adenosine deaminase-related metal-dependent hydrolase
MTYRTLRAPKVFDGERLLEDHVLIVDGQGRVEALLPAAQVPAHQTETFRGVLMPGLINAHCHLELSHFKGLIPCGTGLVDFLMRVVTSRKNVPLVIEELAAAEAEMWSAGIAGVADICNTTDAIPIKKGSRMQWHNLVEVLNFRDENLGGRLDQYRGVAEAHRDAELQAVLTPHAPYSVSRGTFKAINEATAGGIISVHNQETRAENELFRNGGGDFLLLYNTFNTGLSPFEVHGGNSLQAWLPHFTLGQTIILVHNTFTEAEDILFAQQHAEKYGLTLVFCLCPNANLYIENALPPVDLFLKHGCRIVLGTDSYSSNWRLSIASEMATIRTHFPHIPLETLLTWATSNGADVLGWKELGRFTLGTQPGIVLLDETDFSVQRLT